MAKSRYRKVIPFRLGIAIVTLQPVDYDAYFIRIDETDGVTHWITEVGQPYVPFDTARRLADAMVYTLRKLSTGAVPRVNALELAVTFVNIRSHLM